LGDKYGLNGLQRPIFFRKMLVSTIFRKGANFEEKEVLKFGSNEV
jgi:hypothetical protein